MKKVWLAFANTDKFDAINCFRVLGFSNWKMGNRRFSVGDIIYFYVSSERKVMFKTRVEAINLYNDNWDDDQYWSARERMNAIGKKRMKIVLQEEYNGQDLDDERLRMYGLPTRLSPLEQPVYKKYVDCIEYIQNHF